MNEKLVTIYTFDNPAEANIAKNLVESAGIPVLLLDENFSNLYPIHSKIIGGVRLQVPTENVNDASAILKDAFPEVKSEKPTCPECFSDSTEQIKHCGATATLAIISQYLPIPFVKNWKCNNCGNKWY